MILALPVDESRIDASISDSLGRAEYYYIYDIKREEGRFIKNGAIFDTSGAASKAVQLLIDEDVNYIIAVRCGEKAGRILDLADIKVLKPKGRSIKNNIEAWRDLEELRERHNGKYKGGRG